MDDFASESPPSRATRGRYLTVWRSAHSEKTSETDEGKLSGVAGKAVKEEQLTWVSSLVCRAIHGVRRPRNTLVVRDRGPGLLWQLFSERSEGWGGSGSHLERMEEYVKSTRNVHFPWARVGVERVNNSQERPQGAVGDAWVSAPR